MYKRQILLTVTNNAPAKQESADANLVRLPESTTIDDVAGFFGPQMATPAMETNQAAPNSI